MKKNKKQKDDFRKELDAYQAQGIPLWLLRLEFDAVKKEDGYTQKL